MHTRVLKSEVDCDLQDKNKFGYVFLDYGVQKCSLVTFHMA